MITTSAMLLLCPNKFCLCYYLGKSSLDAAEISAFIGVVVLVQGPATLDELSGMTDDRMREAKREAKIRSSIHRGIIAWLVVRQWVLFDHYLVGGARE